MAPRTAKGKKATEVSEAPRKGRGKTKNVEEVKPEVEEQDDDDKAAAPVVEKKKRGKKAAGDVNGVDENGKTEEAPPAKKGRKKNVEQTVLDEKDEEMPESNVDNASDDTPVAENGEEENGEFKEAQSAPVSKGRKKQVKKEPTVKQETKPSRGRKAKQEPEVEEVVESEEKSKPTGKGRGRKAQLKVEVEPEEDKEEEVKPEPAATKGRKKAQPKPVKEKSPQIEKPEAEESQENEVEPLKKKEARGKKNIGKKVQIKEGSEEKNEEEIDEAPAKKRKVNKKKEEVGKGDSKDDDAVEEEVLEAKPKARGRGKKAAVVEPPAETVEEPQDASEAASKRRRKPTDEKAPVDDDKKKPPPKNKAATNYEDLDFSNTSKTKDGKDWNFKISSWNVDGIRAWMNKGGLDYIKYEKPDIICLQETKCAKDKLPDELVKLPGYHAYWECSEKDGYAGVAIYTSQLAMNVQYGLKNEELDNEGRIITAEYEQFYLICTYVPNAGKKLVTLPKRLQWNEEFRKFVKELDKKKPVIICGDMNVAHNEIDLKNPKTNKKNAGFTEEERAGMTDLLGDGFVDTFRALYPEKKDAYTFWTYMMNSRAKNVGWRLDYFIVSERLLPALCDNVIRDLVYGSDHCPIAMFLHLKGADKPKESI